MTALPLVNCIVAFQLLFTHDNPGVTFSFYVPYDQLSRVTIPTPPPSHPSGSTGYREMDLDTIQGSALLQQALPGHPLRHEGSPFGLNDAPHAYPSNQRLTADDYRVHQNTYQVNLQIPSQKQEAGDIPLSLPIERKESVRYDSPLGPVLASELSGNEKENNGFQNDIHFSPPSYAYGTGGPNRQPNVQPNYVENAQQFASEIPHAKNVPPRSPAYELHLERPHKYKSEPSISVIEVDLDTKDKEAKQNAPDAEAKSGVSEGPAFSFYKFLPDRSISNIKLDSEPRDDPAVLETRGENAGDTRRRKANVNTTRGECGECKRSKGMRRHFCTSDVGKI